MNFGFDQISQETPMWAKWVFRIVFVTTTAVSLWIAGTNLFPEHTKVEVMLALKSFDVIVFGVSKLFGIDIKKEGNEN